MRRLLFLVNFIFPLMVLAAAPSAEDRLSGVFQAIEANRLDEALKRVEALIRDHPNFRLAHLVRGDLLLARAQPLQTFGNVAKNVSPEKVDGLRAEALARLQGLRERPGENRVPRQLLHVPRDAAGCAEAPAVGDQDALRGALRVALLGARRGHGAGAGSARRVAGLKRKPLAVDPCAPGTSPRRPEAPCRARAARRTSGWCFPRLWPPPR